MASLQKIGDVKYRPACTLCEAIKTCTEYQPEILFVNPNNLQFKIDRYFLEHTQVKYVCTASTGTSHIDKEYCQKHNIKVIAITKEYDVLNNISSTAELAFGLLLSLVRFIPKACRSVQEGQWNCMPFLGEQLSGMQAGIIGYGRLGKMMAKYCLGFGMQVAVCDPFCDCAPLYNGTLDEICKISKVLSIHVHLNDDTKNLIGYEQISLMNGAYLINTSRGELVDEDAVLAGLKGGCLRGYGADVICDELGNLYRSLLVQEINNYNIVITPHIGGATSNGQYLAYNRACDLLNAALKNHDSP
jgi:D-3-phosphoglycerate dehydrogenase